DTIIVPAGTYTLAIAGTGEQFAATGDLDLRSDMTIKGAGMLSTIIDGGALDRVFEVNSGTITISDLTIRNGNAGADVGGGILSNSVLTLTNCLIAGNSAATGGGIQAGGNLIINRCSITGNTTTANGARISIFATPVVTIDSTTIAGNNGAL